MTASSAQRLRELIRASPASARAALAGLELKPAQALALHYSWELWARPKQLPPPGDWWIWVNMSGRGAGKTRSGAEWIRHRRETGSTRIALIAETAADARDVMVEGESGILACSPPWDRPVYEPSKRRLTWPATSLYPWETQAITFSGDKPAQVRGPQFDSAWCDEFAKYIRADQLFPILDPAVRLGADPRILVTTTPVNSKAMRDLVNDPQSVVVNESTFANSANLPDRLIERLKIYAGTRVGRQELEGQLLDDIEGALWTLAGIDKHRARLIPDEGAKARPPIAPPGHKWVIYDYTGGRMRDVPELVRVVVAVDPAVSSGEDADSTGIVVVGKGEDGHLYVLADRTTRGKPHEWAAAVVAAYRDFEADRVIGEVNNGGELIETVLRAHAPSIPYEAVRASRSKQTRAEPVSALDELGTVHHLGALPELEDEMITWVPGRPSPDRMDARVWGCTYLGLQDSGGSGIWLPGMDD